MSVRLDSGMGLIKIIKQKAVFEGSVVLEKLHLKVFEFGLPVILKQDKPSV